MCVLPGTPCGGDDRCVNYALQAQTPVPLEGLQASGTARSFMVNEAVDLHDRNGDGDTLDTVVTLRDRVRGARGTVRRPQHPRRGRV